MNSEKTEKYTNKILTYQDEEKLIMVTSYNLHSKSRVSSLKPVVAVDGDSTYIALFNLSLKQCLNPEIICLEYLLDKIYKVLTILDLKVAEKLIEDDYQTTLNVFYRLPRYVGIDRVFISETIWIDLVKHYQGISTWLKYWDLKKNTTPLKNNNSYNWLEKEALLTARRYELIYELCNRKYLPCNHNFIWLLVEISILRKMPLCTANSKEELYRNNKNRIDFMNNFEEKPPQYAVKTEDLLYSMNSYVETLAYEVALQNPDFDKNYYRPYLAAYKSANSSRKKNAKLSNPVNAGLSTFPSKKRCGGKIGHKKKKKH